MSISSSIYSRMTTIKTYRNALASCVAAGLYQVVSAGSQPLQLGCTLQYCHSRCINPETRETTCRQYPDDALQNNTQGLMIGSTSSRLKRGTWKTWGVNPSHRSLYFGRGFLASCNEVGDQLLCNHATHGPSLNGVW